MVLKSILIFLLVALSIVADAVGRSAAVNDENSATTTDDAMRARIRRLEAEQARLLKQIKKSAASNPTSELQTELDKLVERVENESLETKKSLYFTSTTAVHGAAAKRYIKEVVERIEDCGTENFPHQGGFKQYGTGIFYFAIDRQGRLVDTGVLKTTGAPALDAHAAKLIQATAPFGVVPTQIHKNVYSKFVFVRTFSFKSEDSADSQIKHHCRFE